MARRSEKFLAKKRETQRVKRQRVGARHKGGLVSNARITLRDKDGNLICRRKARQTDPSWLVRRYHTVRIKLCQSAKNVDLPEHWRTGENVPMTKGGLCKAILKIQLRRLKWLILQV